MSTDDFFEWLPEQASPWARGEIGENWWLFWGHLQDSFAEAAKEAVRARFPSLAAPDALQAQAADRGTERYLGESEPAFRVRLAETFDRYQALGTPMGLCEAVAAVPGIIPRAPTLEDPYPVGYREAWQMDPGSPLWARFWLFLATSWGLPVAWGDAGETWGGGAMWGLTAPVDAVDFLRRQVRRWRAAHARLEAIVITVGGAVVWGEPDVVWGGGAVWGAGTVVTLENL